MATRAKLFKFNRSQAVRLPKALAFPESVKEVEITAQQIPIDAVKTPL